MITIQNVSPHLRATGQHTYEVRINGRLVVRFTHRREQGLAVCLERAAREVKLAEILALEQMRAWGKANAGKD